MQECHFENTFYLKTSLPQERAASSFLPPSSSFLPEDQLAAILWFLSTNITFYHICSFFPLLNTKSGFAYPASFSHNCFHKQIFNLEAAEGKIIFHPGCIITVLGTSIACSLIRQQTTVYTYVSELTSRVKAWLWAVSWDCTGCLRVSGHQVRSHHCQLGPAPVHQLSWGDMSTFVDFYCPG